MNFRTINMIKRETRFSYGNRAKLQPLIIIVLNERAQTNEKNNSNYAGAQKFCLASACVAKIVFGGGGLGVYSNIFENNSRKFWEKFFGGFKA